MDNDTIGYIVLFVFWLLSQLASQAKKKPGGTQQKRRPQKPSRPRPQQPSRAPELPPLPSTPQPAPSRTAGLEAEADALSARLTELVKTLTTSSDAVDERVQEQVASLLAHGIEQDVSQTRAALQSASASQDRRALSEAIERGVALESFLEDLRTTAKTHTSLRRRPETRAARSSVDRLLDEFRAELVPFLSSAGVELAEPPPVAVLWDLGADDRLAKSPLAGSTVFLPRSLASEVLHGSYVPYELARYLGDACPGLYREVYERLGLEVTEPNVVANPAAFARVLFSSYVVRLFGDATGASLFGPNYLRAIARLYQRPQNPAHVTTIYLSRDGTLHPEPPAHLRIRWTARWLSDMGYADEAEETLRAWSELHLDPQELTIYGATGAIPAEPVLAEMDALVTRLFRLEPRALGGRQLAELPGLANWGICERAAAVARQALASGAAASGPARALVSAAFAALEDAPAQARTIRRALYQSLGEAAGAPRRAEALPALPAAGGRGVLASATVAPGSREIAEALVLADLLLERPPHRGRFSR